MPKLTRVLFLIVASLSLALPHASAQEQFKRDLEQVQFVPKGQWITGVSVSYEQSNNKNYQFFIFENITGDTYLFKVSPMLLYSFHDNVAAGGKFRYQRSRTRIDKGSLILDSETHFDADNLYMIPSDYFGTAAFRNYISLGDNRRFGFFNEVQLELGGGQSKLSDHSGEDLTGTFERNFTLNVGLTPGFIMFLNNYSAIEVNIGVLGFGYTHTKAVTDQVKIAKRNAKHANFKINLFSVSFGVAFYL